MSIQMLMSSVPFVQSKKLAELDSLHYSSEEDFRYQQRLGFSEKLQVQGISCLVNVEINQCAFEDRFKACTHQRCFSDVNLITLLLMVV